MIGPLKLQGSLLSGAVLLFLWVRSAPAQERGSISGTVADTSGAVVPGASVTITDTRTNVRRDATTNSAGFYTVGGLIPDPYSVSAEARGFKRAERSAFTLEVAQAAQIDLQLQIGDVSEAVS